MERAAIASSKVTWCVSLSLSVINKTISYNKKIKVEKGQPPLLLFITMSITFAPFVLDAAISVIFPFKNHILSLSSSSSQILGYIGRKGKKKEKKKTLTTVLHCSSQI